MPPAKRRHVQQNGFHRPVVDGKHGRLPVHHARELRGPPDVDWRAEAVVLDESVFLEEALVVQLERAELVSLEEAEDEVAEDVEEGFEVV